VGSLLITEAVEEWIAGSGVRGVSLRFGVERGRPSSDPPARPYHDEERGRHRSAGPSERGLPPPIVIESLLERVAAGDQRALADLYDRTSSYVYSLVRRIVGDPDTAADVSQEVYLQVWRTARSFEPARGSAWSWLALMARSRGIDRVRAERSYRGAVDAAEREPEILAAPLGDPAAEAASGEEAGLVRRAMAELPPEQRSALELAFFGGLSHSEIAARTATPLGTVKTRIRTAMLKLEQALGPTLER
jgi:RNA polymerase sigma-70 factor (ECF subfamily)